MASINVKGKKLTNLTVDEATWIGLIPAKGKIPPGKPEQDTMIATWELVDDRKPEDSRKGILPVFKTPAPPVAKAEKVEKA